MRQTATLSLLESVTSTAVGFVITLMVTPPVLAMFGLPVVTTRQNVGITSVFTALSILRAYVVRRAFNRMI